MALSSIWYGWCGLNAWLFVLAQEVRSEKIAPALGLVSALGSFSSAPYYVLAIGGAAIRIARDRERGIVIACRLVDPWIRTLFRFVVATVAAAAAVWLLKEWLQFPRPWALFGPQLGPGALAADAGASFPSGHATFAAVVVGSLWPRCRGRIARPMLILFLAAVGLSRVLLGAHFPADVVGGYAVGLASVWGAGRLLRGLDGLRDAGRSDQREAEIPK